MKSVVLDTNLLVLLVVGSLDRSLIARHKRTRKFTPEDFDTLTQILDQYQQIVVTPNVVTETSNLLQQVNEATAHSLLRALKQILLKTEEKFVASMDAANVQGYFFLGIADAATLQGALADSDLLTDDLPLYLQASRLGRKAINFTYYQAQNMML